jgi:hypothetical protein
MADLAPYNFRKKSTAAARPNQLVHFSEKVVREEDVGAFTVHRYVPLQV